MTWDWPGSRWWRVDLHAHSPGSYDFHTGPGISPSPEAWVSAAVEAHLDAVVVADHNTGSWIDRIKAACATLGHRLTVYPGVELTASDGTHLIFVLDPSCDGRHVDELLALAGIGVDARDKDTARSSLSVENLLSLQPSRDAIVIAAHANGPHGLLEHDGAQRLVELAHMNLAAVEIDPDKPLDRTWIDGSKAQTRAVPWVYGSDAHDLAKLGRRFTWTKMTQPTLDGLRLALLDGQDSLRPTGTEEALDPNRHAALAIESITVDHAKHIGQSAPFVLGLSPWLNAIIGGRGTGKSTLVDLCRMTLRREVELGPDEPGSVRQAFEMRMRVAPRRREEGLLQAGTVVTLVYRKDGQRYRLGWDRTGTVESIVHLADGDETPEGGGIRERFPVRIYSQKQLFEMAQNPSTLLDVIDESPAVHGAEALRRLQGAETRYLALRAEARSLRSQAASLTDKQANLDDLRRRIEVLSTGGQAEAFSRYAGRNRQDREWSAIVGATRSAVQAVRDAGSGLAVPDLDLRSDPTVDPPARALAEAHAELKGIVGALSADLVAVTDRTLARIEALTSGSKAAEWAADLSAVTQAYERAAEQLAAVGVEDPREYRDLLQQAAALESELATLTGRREAAEERDTEAFTELTRYRAVFSERERARASFCDDRRSEQIQISIRIVDRDDLIRRLAEEIHQVLGIDRFEPDILGIAERMAGPVGQDWDFARLDDEVSRLEQGALNQSPASWVDQRFGSALARVSPERLDRLRLVLPDQTVDVLRSDRGRWLPISQGSPGQQTAALLAFVLSYGNEPIILDQPEDDLDSVLIYDLVVKQLRASKERRQLIVVTHNANIVVHGDAEAITVLEARGDQTRIAFQGGLQESEARDQVCQVLEGGTVAFKERYRRITEGGRSA